MREWRAEGGGEVRVSSLRVRNAVRHDRAPDDEEAIAAGEVSPHGLDEFVLEWSGCSGSRTWQHMGTGANPDRTR